MRELIVGRGAPGSARGRILRRRGLIATLDAQVLVLGLMLVSGLVWWMMEDSRSRAMEEDVSMRLDRLAAGAERLASRQFGTFYQMAEAAGGAVKLDAGALDAGAVTTADEASPGEARACATVVSSNMLDIAVWAPAPAGGGGRGPDGAERLLAACGVDRAALWWRAVRVSAVAADGGRARRLAGATAMATDLDMGGFAISGADTVSGARLDVDGGLDATTDLIVEGDLHGGAVDADGDVRVAKTVTAPAAVVSGSQAAADRLESGDDAASLDVGGTLAARNARIDALTAGTIDARERLHADTALISTVRVGGRR